MHYFYFLGSESEKNKSSSHFAVVQLFTGPDPCILSRCMDSHSSPILPWIALPNSPNCAVSSFLGRSPPECCFLFVPVRLSPAVGSRCQLAQSHLLRVHKKKTQVTQLVPLNLSCLFLHVCKASPLIAQTEKFKMIKVFEDNHTFPLYIKTVNSTQTHSPQKHAQRKCSAYKPIWRVVTELHRPHVYTFTKAFHVWAMLSSQHSLEARAKSKGQAWD